jgi:serine/threonine protein kinase
LVDGGSFGHDVLNGRWHGDVIVHAFKTNDHQDVRDFLRRVRTLTQIRHENIVLYMGAAVHGDTYSIVTNPVRGESLHARLSLDPTPLDTEKAVSMAKQLANAMGYLHAKDIVHGRVSSRNVFLERKVQLSLLDYAVGAPNTVYCSPQVLSCQAPVDGVEQYRGAHKADDVFAFGTLLFELFGSRLPLAGESEQVVAARIRSGTLPRCLSALPVAEKLKKLIQRCWDYESRRRPPFSQMVPHLTPGGCLLSRRHSTSESSGLDQAGKAPIAMAAAAAAVAAASSYGRPASPARTVSAQHRTAFDVTPTY